MSRLGPANARTSWETQSLSVRMVASQGMRSRLGLQGERDSVDKVRILARFSVLGFQLFTARLGPLTMPAKVLASTSR